MYQSIKNVTHVLENHDTTEYVNMSTYIVYITFIFRLVYLEIRPLTQGPTASYTCMCRKSDLICHVFSVLVETITSRGYFYDHI